MVLRLGEMHHSVCQPYPKNKVLFLQIIEEKFCVLWIVQKGNIPGFIIIMNRFHTVTHQHEKQRLQLAVWT
jgi:hypothetical protein